MSSKRHGFRTLLGASLALFAYVIAGVFSLAWADAPGTWTSAGSMTAARTNHTATRLANGKVLLTGPYSSAELYDPDAGSFAPTGSMISGRYQATATLLPNGKVLVAGGSLVAATGSTPLASAELYDPATGTFATTGTMAVARSSHAATLLADGKILITGGYDGMHQPVALVEMYDPSTGAFTVLAHSLLRGRYSHTATLLKNGNVLIVGGNGDDKVVEVSELFDPGTRTFYLSDVPYTPRTDHTATLLQDGRVLIAGGQDTDNNATDMAELYDPATDSMSRIFGKPMIAARSTHTATLLPDGKVLVAGGQNGTGALVSTEIFDPVALSFTATGSMSGGRAWHTSTLLANGKVLVAGGYDFDSSPPSLASAEIFCPDCGVLNATGSLATARTGHTATRLADGTVLIAGGYNPSVDYYLDTAEIYNPATGLYTTLAAHMPRPRGYHTATLLPDGRVLFVGGKNRTYSALASADVYDPATASFSFVALTNWPRIGHTATLRKGEVLIIGGSQDPATIERFKDGHFAALPYNLRWKRQNHTATLLPDGNVLIVGGHLVKDALEPVHGELFHPDTGVSDLVGPVYQNRSHHVATLLPDGQVLVAGGLSMFAGGLTNISLWMAEICDPATKTCNHVADLYEGRFDHTATLLSNGKVLLVGGERRYFSGATLITEYPSAAEIYDPATKSFSYAGYLETARAGHTATLLGNCKVLIAGGQNGLYLASSELYTQSICGSIACGPTLSGISPDSGGAGSSVTISGSNFGEIQGSATITFNGVSAGPATSWTDTRITVNVPAGASTGPVVVTVNGVPSNAVTFTVASICAADVSSQVTVSRGGFRYNRVTRRYVQQISLTNSSGTSIPGPVSLALDGMPAAVTLFNKTGTTSCATPVSPYVAVNVGTDGVLSSGESANVTLEFVDPANAAIVYSTRILTGSSN